MAFARIFVNSETTEAYRNAFEQFFRSTEENYGIKLIWKHIHGSGIVAIISDQDMKQIAGEWSICNIFTIH
jgi:hypothetical protein